MHKQLMVAQIPNREEEEEATSAEEEVVITVAVAVDLVTMGDL